jgi:peptidyl-prolyl cis-trans isomerase C
MARRSALASLALLALLALVAAGCGGGSDEEVPSDAVAVVDGAKVTRTAYDQLLVQARRSFQQQKREFPKAGTAERKEIDDQAVRFLVQRQQYAQQAEDMNVTITDKDVEQRLDQIKKQYFGGDEKKYEQQLKAQGLTDAQVRADVRAQIIEQRLYNAVTKDIKVTDVDVQKYYDEHKEQYGTPEQRDVRHILVKTRAEADRLYNQLKAGASFAALAKLHSQDPGSKDNGGKLTISKGQTVAPFDQTAFLLSTNRISRPVKTQYGYHIIQPISAVKPAKTQSLNKALKDQIRAQLEQTKKDAAMTKWVKGLDSQYEDKVSYAAGFSPAPSVQPGTTSGSTAP